MQSLHTAVGQNRTVSFPGLGNRQVHLNTAEEVFIESTDFSFDISHEMVVFESLPKVIYMTVCNDVS